MDTGGTVGTCLDELAQAREQTRAFCDEPHGCRFATRNNKAIKAFKFRLCSHCRRCDPLRVRIVHDEGEFASWNKHSNTLLRRHSTSIALSIETCSMNAPCAMCSVPCELQLRLCDLLHRLANSGDSADTPHSVKPLALQDGQQV